MKNCLGIDETPSAREQSFKTASKLKRKLQTNIEMESALLMEILFLVEFIHVKIQEASKNSDLDIQWFLGINKALQSKEADLVSNTSKLTEIY